MASDVDVIFHDQDLLVVSKPSGMLVHRGLGRDGPVLVEWARTFLDRDVVHPIHRLDRATSGVVVFALSPEIARNFSDQFNQKAVKKTYLALVRGQCPDSGRIDHPVPNKPKGPRVPAVTEFRRLSTAETEPRHVSLVEAHPQTGRFHQIRRHLKHINHPLIGDSNYGKGQLNREFTERYGLTRLALHALCIEFAHPKTGQILLAHAEIPEDLTKPLSLMGFAPKLFNGSGVKGAS